MDSELRSGRVPVVAVMEAANLWDRNDSAIGGPPGSYGGWRA
jgi:hypothetical protein